MDMFTNISQIIGLVPRHAENADTRQEIKRHDPDQQRGREHEESEDGGIFGDDSAVVSVDALEIFLKNFLQSMDEKSAEPEPEGQKKQDKPVALQHPRQSSNQNTVAARAASAYGRNSRNQSAPSRPSAEAVEAILGGEDIRIIHVLLDDIIVLKKQGTDYINIEKGESFLLSLKAAVQKAKNT